MLPVRQKRRASCRLAHIVVECVGMPCTTSWWRCRRTKTRVFVLKRVGESDGRWPPLFSWLDLLLAATALRGDGWPPWPDQAVSSPACCFRRCLSILDHDRGTYMGCSLLRERSAKDALSELLGP